MTTIYRATRGFNNLSVTYESTESMEDAIYRCYLSAFQNGDWKPRTLREKWWQFWLPKEHDYIERRILEEATP